MLSAMSWFVTPFNATYCVSKHAALAVTDAARIQLRGQGTRVIGVYAGFIDTDLAAGIDRPKTPPLQVARRAIDGIRKGTEHVLADTRAEEVWRAMRLNPGLIAVQMQRLWDEAAVAAS
jgi:NAD(P)-dependent dehydrogenase (short-subunit alcohol dehydrogenase family)